MAFDSVQFLCGAAGEADVFFDGSHGNQGTLKVPVIGPGCGTDGGDESDRYDGVGEWGAFLGGEAAVVAHGREVGFGFVRQRRSLRWCELLALLADVIGTVVALTGTSRRDHHDKLIRPSSGTVHH